MWFDETGNLRVATRHAVDGPMIFGDAELTFEPPQFNLVDVQQRDYSDRVSASGTDEEQDSMPMMLPIGPGSFALSPSGRTVAIYGAGVDVWLYETSTE